MLICAFDIPYARNRYSPDKSHRENNSSFLLVVGNLIQILFFHKCTLPVFNVVRIHGFYLMLRLMPDM